MNLLSVREAQERILQKVQTVGQTKFPLEHATRRVLAKDIRAAADLPSFDNSSMDGFALRSQDTSASRVTLRVVADVAAGAAPTRSLGPHEAARIMTGAPLPPGADAVIPVEETDFTERGAGVPAPAQVTLTRKVDAGENVRTRGSDLRAGETVLAKRHRLRAQDLGLLAMLGIANVPVYNIPRIAILSSGDELIPVDAPLTEGKIHDSNSYALAVQIQDAGAEPVRLGVARDERAAVESLLDRAADMAVDLILTSAGVSVGAFDFVKEVVESKGNLNFWRVNMRPGKPLAFGDYRGIPFVGLPGNPVSAFVTFEVFVRPAIEKLSGLEPRPRQRTTVRLAEAIESDGRESYLRAVVNEEGIARLTGHQGSGNLFSLVQANALLIIPAGVKSRPASSEVEAWLI
ncbi:MAG: molybdopterin molybdenumtransferase MoeA [Anaerolineaceae bacterium]|nr:MAG: molybdopterin molybdenumtransferase MoeA [Anaerolineaceae bacterium]